MGAVVLLEAGDEAAGAADGVSAGASGGEEAGEEDAGAAVIAECQCLNIRAHLAT